METTGVALVVPVGTALVYYNKWTGFETEEFQGQFRGLSYEEIRALKSGEAIYVDVDPLHPQGKVYGRIKAVVTKTEFTPENEAKVFYEGGNYSGFIMTRNLCSCRGIEKSVNEEVLAGIIDRLPLSKVI